MHGIEVVVTTLLSAVRDSYRARWSTPQGPASVQDDGDPKA